MTDKSFYQAAAAEVSNGVIDHALWIKVNAELPSANDIVRQAKYIQLRAEELGHAARSKSISSFVPHTRWQWILYAGTAFVVACILAAVTNSGGVFSMVLVAAMLAGGVLQIKYGGQSAPNVTAPHVAPTPPPAAPVALLPPPPVDKESTPTEGMKPEQSALSLSAGDFGLAKTYWLFQILPAFIVSLVLRNVLPSLALLVLLIFSIYEMFALPGVWNAATRYTGLKLWAGIAKIGVVGAVLSLAFSALLLITAAGNIPAIAPVSAVEPAPITPTPSTTAANDNVAYNNEVDALVRIYPELDTKSSRYNAALISTINEKEKDYETQGLVPANALARAAHEVMSANESDNNSHSYGAHAPNHHPKHTSQSTYTPAAPKETAQTVSTDAAPSAPPSSPIVTGTTNQMEAQSVSNQIGCGAVTPTGGTTFQAQCSGYSVLIDCVGGSCHPLHTIKN